MNKEYKVKRTFDLILSLAGMFFSFPLWVIIMLAIMLEDGLPVFYIQERVGRFGKIFMGIKFRSMVKNAEKASGPVQAVENDPRVTKVGRILRKTAMDELPQLINIAKGQMSFVGPRALRPIECGVDGSLISDNSDKEFNTRHQVMPGLTGAAQVLAPRSVSRKDKLRYDLWYIENQSFLLDVNLIIYSFWISFKSKWDSSRSPLPRQANIFGKSQFLTPGP